jgi:hypothetical protein
MPLLTVGPIDTFGATFSNANVSFEHDGKIVAEGSAITAGSFTVIARYLTAERLTMHSDTMHMDAQATIYVAFQDVTMPREPVDRTLEQIVETVANVIPRFNGFFV